MHRVPDRFEKRAERNAAKEAGASTISNFRTEAMTSRLAQLAIIDVLIACLALSDYERAVKTLRRTFDVLSLKRY